jgi:hypothetical protein
MRGAIECVDLTSSTLTYVILPASASVVAYWRPDEAGRTRESGSAAADIRRDYVGAIVAREPEIGSAVRQRRQSWSSTVYQLLYRQ